MSNIVVLTGSPRKGGNSSVMADAFVLAAENKGHAVTRFDVAFMNITTGCHGCEKCYSVGEPCIYDDDFNVIAKAIYKADVIVFAAPVYWYSFPAQIKSVIDRFFSFNVKGIDFSDKKTALLSCCYEGPEAFEAMVMEYNKSVHSMKAVSIGEVLIPHVNSIGAINRTDGAALAAAIADKL